MNYMCRKWRRIEVSRMQRLCPACFTELAEEANYCPVCGKCMREPVGQTSQYVGGVPITTVFEIKDCAIHIGVSGIGLEENKYKP
jgi:predicted amidophosphoribosyltransferase